MKIMIKKLFLLTVLLSFSLGTQNAMAATYRMPPPGNDIVGQNLIIKVQKGQSFNSLSKKYDISIHELIEANPQVRGNQLRAGQTLLIPTEFILPKFRKGIVINLAELRLYYFTPDGKYVKTYPVGLGKREWRTPIATTSVISKKVNPDWNVPKSIKGYIQDTYGKTLPDVIEGGTPENPLGHRAMYLGVSGYLIHGNNSPDSIGKFVSSGCIRMHNQDVEELYPQVKIGTPVRIVNLSQKAGWRDGVLYLESHIPVNLPNETMSALNNDSVEMALRAAMGEHPAEVNWNEVERVSAIRTGVPEPIGRQEVSTN